MYFCISNLYRFLLYGKPPYQPLAIKLSHGNNFQQAVLGSWSAIPGSLQKVASLITKLNTTALGQAAIASAGRMSENMIMAQLSESLPANMTNMISGYMLSLESGAMDDMNATFHRVVNMVSLIVLSFSSLFKISHVHFLMFACQYGCKINGRLHGKIGWSISWLKFTYCPDVYHLCHS